MCPPMRCRRARPCRRPMRCRSRARKERPPRHRPRPDQASRIPVRNLPRGRRLQRRQRRIFPAPLVRRKRRRPMPQHRSWAGRRLAARLWPPRPPSRWLRIREGRTRSRRHRLRRHPNPPQPLPGRFRPRRKFSGASRSAGLRHHRRRVRLHRSRGQHLRRHRRHVQLRRWRDWRLHRRLGRPRRRPRSLVRLRRLRLSARRRPHLRRDRPRRLQPGSARRTFRDAENRTGQTSVWV
jgi:hypothetical protein